MADLLTPEQIEKIFVRHAVTLDRKKTNVYYTSEIEAMMNEAIQAYKESLSFTNEKLVEELAQRLSVTYFDKQEYSQRPYAWVNLYPEYKEAYKKDATDLITFLSPYLSPIEQAKKEERERIIKKIQSKFPIVHETSFGHRIYDVTPFKGYEIVGICNATVSQDVWNKFWQALQEK